MAMPNFYPFANDLIDLIDIFSKTASVLNTASNSLEDSDASFLNNLRASAHEFQKRSDLKAAPKSSADIASTPDQEGTITEDKNGDSSRNSTSATTSRANSERSQLALGGIASEVRILRAALLEPIQAINTLLSMYIVESFDDPLIQLLTPTQCAQLLEAIYLADVVSELDKQLQVLKAAADDHGIEHDTHFELVNDIKANLADALGRMKSLAVQYAQMRDHKSTPNAEHQDGDLLSLGICIQDMYADLQDQPDVTRNLLEEQERTIIALKLFLEDKVEKFKQRWQTVSDLGEDGGYCKSWPSATIPTAQLATILLSTMLPHLKVSSTNHSESPQTPGPKEEPKVAELHAQPIPQSEHLDLIDQEEAREEEPAPVSQDTEPASVSNPSTDPVHTVPSALDATRVKPHVKFNLPPLLDKRRDSAISLMSSIEKPEPFVIHEDETLPGNEGSECEEVLEEEKNIIEDDQSFIPGIPAPTVPAVEAVEEHIAEEIQPCEEPAHGNETDADLNIGKSDVDVEYQPTTSEEGPVEDLYSADDDRPLTRLEPIPIPAPSPPEQVEETASSAQSPRCHEPHVIPFLSSHWPQRAWLQSILSVLAPGPEAQVTSPLSPSFSPEALASPAPNPSSSEWYSGYDAWWGFSMRGASLGSNRDEEAESTTTSTSEQSWGAGSRSTVADSIDV